MLRVVVLAALLSACGAEYPKFTGTFNGQELVVRSAFFTKQIVGDGDPQVVLFFSDTEDLCDKLHADKWPTGGAILRVRPFTIDGTVERGPIGPGDYHFKGTAPAPEGPGPEFNKYCDGKFTAANPGSCDDIVPPEEGNVAGGKLALTAYDLAGTISGTLDLTFASGDTLAADFSLALCEFNYSATAPLPCGD